MDIAKLDPAIVDRGRELFAGISGETPSLSNKQRWTGKVMEWAMEHESFKTQLFRFVDVLPALTTDSMLADHIRDYFGGDDQELPAVLRWGAKGVGVAGAFGTKVLSAAIRYNVQDMARQFIVGDDAREAVKNISELRDQGFAFGVDVLGEATVCEEEAEQHVAAYLELIASLAAHQETWPSLGLGQGAGALDWGHAPKINVSVKPTALHCQVRPQDFEGSVAGILGRMRRIYERTVEAGGFLCIDMESHRYKDLTLEVYRRLRSDSQFRDHPCLGIAMQAYLRDTDRDLLDLLAWARAQGLPISVRLVKGAYWDYETVVAQQHGWEVPVYTHKAETDAAFERQAAAILENHEICHLACASHNLRSIAAVIEMARELRVPEERFESQVLYGMAEPVRKALRNVAGRLRLYCPYGEMIPGMAYLVRRLLENTANESFIRQSFAEGADAERLLENPLTTLEREWPASTPRDKEAASAARVLVFKNEPPADFTQAELRHAFPRAIGAVRGQLGKTYPLFIDGQDVETPEKIPSENPADPAEIIGSVCQATREDIDRAIAAAKGVFPVWRDTAPDARAGYLMSAAALARRRLIELAAWQVLEVGKQWDQAYADVCEAIDFMEYYAREMIRLGRPQPIGSAPGETNSQVYEPKGIAAVIAPWNFPLAIAAGMVSAAIVTGNCVIFKPSGRSSVVGHHLVELFSEVELPRGVFNYTPGRGSAIGDHLVEHPDISLIAFTGSVETGLRIVEKAAKVQPGQANVKKVISEMGGKNAVIVDDDADLDEAVPQVLSSAIGYQGQKCSACSRVIVLDNVHDRFVARLISAAQSIEIGPAEHRRYQMGPVIDGAARESIVRHIEIGGAEGGTLYRSETPTGGYYAPLTILGGIRPEHRIAQEEVFGPVLCVMRVKDMDQALEWANSTRFALTGGIFSRSPKNLKRAARDFRVGNLYLNRGITGAIVGRQPFGGSRMSGVGTKAGGPEYLLHFVDPRIVTENTMRRGFTPDPAQETEKCPE